MRAFLHQGRPACARIVEMTVSRWPWMSWFQNRRTVRPPRARKASRASSRRLSACCEPSASTTSRAPTHRKSTMYGPAGDLTAEFQLRQPPIAQQPSQPLFGLGRPAAHGARRLRWARGTPFSVFTCRPSSVAFSPRERGVNRSRSRTEAPSALPPRGKAAARNARSDEGLGKPLFAARRLRWPVANGALRPRPLGNAPAHWAPRLSGLAALGAAMRPSK